MKKAIAIFLITTYLFSTTELSQFLKIPAFVDHYIEHKAQNSDLTIWEFLYLHYANGNVRDADYEKDMKLPFKTFDTFSSQLIVELPQLLFSIVAKKPTCFYYSPKKYFHNTAFLIQSYLSCIWQPPKFC